VRVAPRPSPLASTLRLVVTEVPMKFTPLKLRRLERRLLQIEVAKHAAVPCSRLSAIENGEVDAQPDELERIAAALDIPAQELGTKNASHRAPTSRTRSVVRLLHPVGARSIAS
jgi:transcriptional regulator with XRE-family HTH domain